MQSETLHSSTQKPNLSNYNTSAQLQIQPCVEKDTEDWVPLGSLARYNYQKLIDKSTQTPTANTFKTDILKTLEGQSQSHSAGQTYKHK